MVRPMIPATARTAARSGAFRRVAALPPVVEVWVGVSGLARPFEHMVNPVGTGGDAGLVESSPALNQWSIAEAVINQTPPSPLSRPARDDDPPLKKKTPHPNGPGQGGKKRHHLFRLASANHSAPSPPSLPARSIPGRATPRGARSRVPVTPAARSPRTPVCTPPHPSPPRF